MNFKNRKLFKKYAFTGNLNSDSINKVLNYSSIVFDQPQDKIIEDPKTRDTDIRDLKLQLSLYRKLLDENKEDKRQIIERIKFLIELTSNEIAAQRERKAQMEEKSGFLLATWGIIFSLTADKIGKNIFILTLAIVSLILCGFSIYVMKFNHYKFESRINNFLSTCESEEMFYIRILDGITNSWEFNNDKINDKSKLYTAALVFTSLYSIATAWTIYKG